MYVHLGMETVVKEDDIIGIFDLDSTTVSKHTRKFLNVAEKENIYEQDRVGGCQVVKTEDMGYVMFYIGYENIDKAQICMACSPDGITQWKKSPLNPIVEPEEGSWDGEACYKPSFLWNEEENKWMLWYNGRSKTDEFVGFVSK